jgi:hypothetical protein
MKPLPYAPWPTLIGDVHQPLHCGNGTDMGGNQVKVKFFWESSNLHRVWDSGLIDYWKMSYTEYSTWIMGTVTPEHIQSWKGTTTKDWVRESVEMREQCYSTMGDPERMGYRYVYDNTELLHLRLAQGRRAPRGRPQPSLCRTRLRKIFGTIKKAALGAAFFMLQ